MIKNVLKLTFIDEFLLEQHEQGGLAGLAHLVVAVHETVGDGGQDVGGHRVQRQQLVLVAAHGQVRHLLHHLRTHRRLYNITGTVSRTPIQHPDSQPHTNTTPRLSAAHQYNTETQQSAAQQYTNTETVSRTQIHKHRDSQPHTNTQTPRQSAAHKYTNTEMQQSVSAHKYTNTEMQQSVSAHKYTNTEMQQSVSAHKYTPNSYKLKIQGTLTE